MAASSTISIGLARGLLYSGLTVLLGTIVLSLYPVPSGTPGLPNFPFVDLSFPLLPVLWVLSIILLASGWAFHPRGSLAQIVTASGAIFAVTILAKVVSFLTAIPFVVGSMTAFVEPYGAQTTFFLSLGPLLALFGAVFWLVQRRERRKFGGDLKS